jgi:hypothetical protein
MTYLEECFPAEFVKSAQALDMQGEMDAEYTSAMWMDVPRLEARSSSRRPFETIVTKLNSEYSALVPVGVKRYKAYGRFRSYSSPTSTVISRSHRSCVLCLLAATGTVPVLYSSSSK